MSERLGKTFVLGLIVVYSLALPFAKVFPQQSTTGPIPPPDMDLGLRPPLRSQHVIQGISPYLWRHGCGPTALGMVVGFWDTNGYADLVPGDAATQTAAVNAMIADDQGNPNCSSGQSNHYRDYACPIDNAPGPLMTDRSQTGGAHADNCVADFMMTSRSSSYNYYGWSWFSDVEIAFRNYVTYVMPAATPSSSSRSFADFSWQEYKTEIDNRRPIVLLVDSDADGSTDHFITGIGYDDATMEYAAYNTWDSAIHWYRWRPMAPGAGFGIYGVTLCALPVTCVDSDNDTFGDPGHPENTCPTDNCPNVYNPDQHDIDSDGLGDVCDPDIDGDGILNVADNCPLKANSSQQNSDSDSLGDVCDNCPYVTNDDQWDGNADGIGDWCDGKIHVHTEDMPIAYLNVPYVYFFHAAGGSFPRHWTYISGDLPYGLNFEGDTVGCISGIPSYKATFFFSLVVKDNDVPPRTDTVAIPMTIKVQPVPPYICGDADGDKAVDISDVVYLIAYIFSGGPAPKPLQAGDVNCGQAVDVSDVVYLITYIFSGGTRPCFACQQPTFQEQLAR